MGAHLNWGISFRQVDYYYLNALLRLGQFYCFLQSLSYFFFSYKDALLHCLCSQLSPSFSVERTTSTTDFYVLECLVSDPVSNWIGGQTWLLLTSVLYAMVQGFAYILICAKTTHWFRLSLVCYGCPSVPQLSWCLKLGLVRGWCDQREFTHYSRLYFLTFIWFRCA